MTMKLKIKEEGIQSKSGNRSGIQPNKRKVVIFVVANSKIAKVLLPMIFDSSCRLLTVE
jgi:hypothetical protein